MEQNTSAMLQIGSLPSFSVNKISTDVQDRIKRQERIVGSIIGFLIIAGISIRILSGISFDKELSKNHDKMEQAEIILRDMERSAFKDNRYKDPQFKKAYFEIRGTYTKLKKEHLFSQTNHSFGIIRKANGICPKCLEESQYGR